MCQADDTETGQAVSASPLQAEEGADALIIGTDKCYITLVFEWTDVFSVSNVFVSSPFGPAVGAATGNLLTVNDILEEALGEIANGSCDAEEIAENAIERANQHVRQQMELHPRKRKIEERSDTASLSNETEV